MLEKLDWLLYQDYVGMNSERVKTSLPEKEWRKQLLIKRAIDHYLDIENDSILTYKASTFDSTMSHLFALKPYKGKFRFIEFSAKYADGTYGVSLIRIYEIDKDTLKTIFSDLGSFKQINPNGKMTYCEGDYRFQSTPFIEMALETKKNGRFSVKENNICGLDFPYNLVKSCYKYSEKRKGKIEIDDYLLRFQSKEKNELVKLLWQKGSKKLYLATLEEDIYEDNYTDYHIPAQIVLCDTQTWKCKVLYNLKNQHSIDSVYIQEGREEVPNVVIRSYGKDKNYFFRYGKYHTK
jgi:hypothetical protein